MVDPKVYEKKIQEQSIEIDRLNAELTKAKAVVSDALNSSQKVINALQAECKTRERAELYLEIELGKANGTIAKLNERLNDCTKMVSETMRVNVCDKHIEEKTKNMTMSAFADNLKEMRGKCIFCAHDKIKELNMINMRMAQMESQVGDFARLARNEQQKAQELKRDSKMQKKHIRLLQKKIFNMEQSHKDK